MAYAKIQGDEVTQFPYSIGKLRKEYSSTSFPKVIPNHVLADYGVVEVKVMPVPEADPKTQKVVRADMPTKVMGEWHLEWSIVEKTEEEKQKHQDVQANKARSRRNALLSRTDYLALSDNTLTTEMATYRQALRDITDHANFPYLNEDDWPTKP